MAEPIDAHDARRRRCPMLGHDVSFAYCRTPGRDLPCAKVGDCWWETFDVEGFIRTHFTPDEVAQILAPPPDKAATIVDLIAKARQAHEQEP